MENPSSLFFMSEERGNLQQFYGTQVFVLAFVQLTWYLAARSGEVVSIILIEKIHALKVSSLLTQNIEISANGNECLRIRLSNRKNTSTTATEKSTLW